MTFRVLRLTPKRIVAFSSLIALSVAAVFCVRVWRRANSAVESGAQAALSEGSIPTKVLTVRPSSSRFEPVLTPADFQSAIEFQGDFYVCGRSALFRYRESELKQVWHVGRELPPWPLVSLAVRKGVGITELWIATDGGGILIYDGNTFREIVPQQTTVRKISAMLPVRNGQVLVGTPDAGLYVTDGKSFHVFHSQFTKVQVTTLAGDGDRFWVGTRAVGAWRWSGGEALHIASELPDPQVLSIAVRGERAWIGTPLGLAEFSGDKLARRLADGLFAQALAERDGTLWIGTVDQGTVAIPLEARMPRPQFTTRVNELESTRSFAELGDELVALGPQHISTISGNRTVLTAEPASASGHITALHEDARGRLWIGYFDRGLDLIQPSSPSKSVHFEDDVLFCVNRIKENPQDGSIAVATANGLAEFDATPTLRQVIDRESGLIANHVTDILFLPENPGEASMAVATPAGLSFIERGAISSMYAFHGLVNNHVSTLANLDGTLYAGTLGGLSTVRNGLVQASFTTANSQLRQNWITASAVFEAKLYLGTYGSGAVSFSNNGFASLPGFSGRRVEINANAMLATDRALYAGTNGEGLAFLPRGEERWQFVTDGLPSLNVTALDERDGRLYVGTDNGLVRISETNLLP